MKKKLLKSLTRISIIVGGIILSAIFLLYMWFFGLQPIYDWRLEKKLNKDLSENWSKYSDQELGYSFSYPKSWRVSQVDRNLYIHGEAFSLNLSDKGITFVSFSKNPSKDPINLGLVTNIRRNKSINSKEFTVFHNNYDLEQGLNSGRYLLSSDQNLMIHIINGYTTDNSLTQQFSL